MPIRINLLAEQIAAEEARRKDPLKRALIIGSVIASLTLLWSIMLIFQVSAAKAEAARTQADLARLDNETRDVKRNKMLSDEAYLRFQSLERLATNRVLWGNVLNDIQHEARKIEGIKLDEFNAEHRYSTNKVAIETAEFKFPYTEPRPSWKFWAANVPPQNFDTLISNEFRLLTNNLPYTTNQVPVSMKLVKMTTNTPPTAVTASIEVITPTTATEDTTIILRARSYSKEARPSDALSKALNEGPYLKPRLRKGQGGGIFLREIGKPKEDFGDTTGQSYTPFTLEIQFEPRIFTSEAK